ncbi:MAG: NAD(P)/FAD-dependent oxidoreductase [Bacilli bacterium]|jgi:thioredoxin reductase (NADPH)|nr:NAD(P)/FAD-dependent oxidoreductase [Bacilli bacterium]
MEQKRILIVGGGPIGLYAANLLEIKKIPYHLFEAENHLGGQPANLYPKKEVADVPLYPPMPAEEVVKTLVNGLDKNNCTLSCEVTGINEKDKGIVLETKRGQFEGNFVIVATGLGFHKPRPLGLENESKCSNILYSLKDPSLMKDKRVVIFGGGDSALDWAKQLSRLSSDVSLVHRRMEFRGNPETIKDCKLDIHLPYIPFKITEKGGFCREITIKNVTDSSLITIPCDYVLVNYGQIPSPTTFGLPLTSTGFGVVTDGNMRARKRIYVIGDCLYNPNYKKRIAPGMKEAEIAIDSINGSN